MAVHADIRHVPRAGAMERALNALAYLLVLVTFTGTAAMGGYVLGARSRPSAADVAIERSAAVHAAVSRAVAVQVAADRGLRDRAVARRVAAQRAQDMTVAEHRVMAQQAVDAQQAARAFARGRRVKVAACSAAARTAARC